MNERVSIVMPCLNEEETIGLCLEKAQQVIKSQGYRGEVIVADNGSTDASLSIAQKLGAKIVKVELKGYGSAYLGGLTAATGDYLVMADSDNTYDFNHTPKFIEKLKEGYDFVNGNRFGNIWSFKSLPTLHRYFGALALSSFLNLFFRTGLTDAHCGMRAFTKEALRKMDLKCPGMEFASEMLIKAKKAKLKVAEVPISYDPRSTGSKLNPLGDGWRHLKTILGFYFKRIN